MVRFVRRSGFLRGHRGRWGEAGKGKDGRVRVCECAGRGAEGWGDCGYGCVEGEGRDGTGREDTEAEDKEGVVDEDGDEDTDLGEVVGRSGGREEEIAWEHVRHSSTAKLARTARFESSSSDQGDSGKPDVEVATGQMANRNPRAEKGPSDSDEATRKTEWRLTINKVRLYV
ncbi:hypothetical protein FRC12_003903 [Ceratobasidium sp. 428]|nr:hypothetical protein FRC12_003903 [Ceratobasidium sp. 428]